VPGAAGSSFLCSRLIPIQQQEEERACDTDHAPLFAGSGEESVDDVHRPSRAGADAAEDALDAVAHQPRAGADAAKREEVRAAVLEVSVQIHQHRDESRDAQRREREIKRALERQRPVSSEH